MAGNLHAQWQATFMHNGRQPSCSMAGNLHAQWQTTFMLNDRQPSCSILLVRPVQTKINQHISAI
jgi:hypothetical protein